MNNSNHVVGRPFPPGVSGNPGGRPKDTDEIAAQPIMAEITQPEQTLSLSEKLERLRTLLREDEE